MSAEMQYEKTLVSGALTTFLVFFNTPYVSCHANVFNDAPTLGVCICSYIPGSPFVSIT